MVLISNLNSAGEVKDYKMKFWYFHQNPKILPVH